ncbi:hypothetical protein [Kocuria massiliensis]|uniref:hypothetical protein n=1 Tax=Kocuria massiliensis TaxID=1926282 RepID=UPI0022B965BF|nr:hypothetical protein [Kocuria massiliensis]
MRKIDELEALTLGMEYRANLPEGSPGKKISDKRLMRLIKNEMGRKPPRHKGPITYSDPTGNQAVARADRSRR